MLHSRTVSYQDHDMDENASHSRSSFKTTIHHDPTTGTVCITTTTTKLPPRLPPLNGSFKFSSREESSENGEGISVMPAEVGKSPPNALAHKFARLLQRVSYGTIL